jgi:hypothetical protein
MLCLAVGLIFYWWTVGVASPIVIWASTVDAIRAGQQYAATYYVPLSSYYATNYEIYVPPFTTAMLFAVNRGRLWDDSVGTRIAWFSLSYVAAYIVVVFGLRMNIAEYFWYFGHLTIVVYLAVPAMIGRLAQTAGTSVAGCFAAAVGVVAVAVKILFPVADRFAAAAAGNGFVVLGLGIACAATLVGVLARNRIVVLVCSAMAGLLMQVPFLSPTHLSVYDRQVNAVEAPLFETIVRYHALLNRFDRPRLRVRTWFRTTDVSLLSVSSSNLLFTLQDPWTGTGMPAIGEREQRLLHDPETGYVLLLAQTPSDVDAALRRLAVAGVAFASREQAQWAYPPLTVYAQLVALEHSP